MTQTAQAMRDAEERGDRSWPSRVARVRVGDYRVAVDAMLVEQVLDIPLAVTPLPGAPRHVPGAVLVRDVPIPLLDLGALFTEHRARDDADAPLRTTSLTMIVRHEGRRFAVPLHLVVALETAAPSRFVAVSTQQQAMPALFSHLYAPQEGEAPEVLFDAQAIVQVAGLHAVLAPMDGGRQRGDGLRNAYFVLDVNGLRFAIEARSVRHIGEDHAVEPVGFDHPALRGFLTVTGERVGVVSLAPLLTLAGTPSTRGHVVVVNPYDEQDTRASVALHVNAVCDMEFVSEDAIRPLVGDDGGHDPVLRGSYVSARHGTVVVLDRTVTWQAANLVDSRALFGRGERTGTQEQAGREHYLVYRVHGGLLASRVCDARAALQLPQDFVDLRREHSALVGLFTHQHRPVQVVDLAALMGHPRVEAVEGRPLLVITTRHGLLGLLVDEVVCLRHANSTPIPGASLRRHGILPPFTSMVSVALDGTERNVTVLELDALADHADLLSLLSAFAIGDRTAA